MFLYKQEQREAIVLARSAIERTKERLTEQLGYPQLLHSSH